MRAFTFRFALVLPLLIAIAGCEGTINDIPTTPDPTIVTETFSGTINVNGAATHIVQLVATGEVKATLTSLGDNPPPKIGFSLGTLAGATCTTVLHNDSAVVTSELSGTVTTLVGTLCARVYDVGALTESVPYTFTVSHP